LPPRPWSPEFTPAASTLGGILIDLSAVMLMTFNGRIVGISGIVGRLLPPYAGSDVGSPIVDLGPARCALAYAAVTGAPFAQSVSGSAALTARAGVLVGFGAGLGGGCTSGHGVCGIARLSTCSLVATAIFMATGFATVFVMRHVLGADHARSGQFHRRSHFSASAC
jgi:uncharacterized membrane protein YedE/YeeE